MCQPCEALDAPDAVKVVWLLVDEYTLMEAERAMLKLMRGLDKHLQHVRQATAVAPATGASDTVNTAASVPVNGDQSSELSTPSPARHESQSFQTQQHSSAGAQTDMPDTWSGPNAHKQSAPAGNSQAPLAPQGSLYREESRSPELQEAFASGNLQQLSRITIDQQVEQHAHQQVDQQADQQADLQAGQQAGQQSNWHTDQQVGQQASQSSVLSQPYPLSQQARRGTRDPGAQRVSSDVLQASTAPASSSTALPLVKASITTRKEKIEYRLSQDDVYSPTANEVQALLQSGDNAGFAASDAASNMQSSLNGVTDGVFASATSLKGLTDGGLSGVSNVFTNPLMKADGSLSGSQTAAGMQQETASSMLLLTSKIQNAQVSLLRHASFDSSLHAEVHTTRCSSSVPHISMISCCQ